MTELDLHCPECRNPVTKAGGAWSGRTKFQQYRCLRCGRVTIRPLDESGKPVEAKPFGNNNQTKGGKHEKKTGAAR
jgi:transposase-like protein